MRGRPGKAEKEEDDSAAGRGEQRNLIPCFILLDNVGFRAGSFALAPSPSITSHPPDSIFYNFRRRRNMLFNYLILSLSGLSVSSVHSTPLPSNNVRTASLAKQSVCPILSPSNVTSSRGQVKGSRVDSGGLRFVLPYAFPPIGSRRFSDPTAVNNFSS